MRIIRSAGLLVLALMPAMGLAGPAIPTASAMRVGTPNLPHRAMWGARPMPGRARLTPHPGAGYWQSFPEHAGGWHWNDRRRWNGAYRVPMRGFIMPSFWLSPRYRVGNWWSYGLGDPGWGRSWVRYYDDAVLIDDRGMIYDNVEGLDWDRQMRGPVPEYVGDEADADYRAPERQSMGYGYGADYDDRVTWGGGREWTTGWTIQAQPGTMIVVPPGSVTTITFAPQVVPSEEGVAPVPKAGSPRAYAKPKIRQRPKAWLKPKAKARCACAH